MALLDSLKERARGLKREAYTLYLVVRHPRTPWYAKALAALVVAYAFSPVDLIPDFVPVLGYLDDLILVPAGVALTLRLVPPDVLEACRAEATELIARGKPVSRVGAAIVVGLWILALAWMGGLIWRWLNL